MCYDRMRRAALEWDAIQQTRIRLNNLYKALDRLKRPYPPYVDDFLASLRKSEGACVREIFALAQDSSGPYFRVSAFLDQTPGLGPSVLCVLGLVPEITAFANPAKLWAYLGLAVVDGAAVRTPAPPPPNNPRGKPGTHFSRRLRAYATHRVVDPIIKNMACAYRALYDQRRVHTTQTHPEWALETNKDGKLTPSGHYHSDAVRYVAKRIWRDVWRAANEPAPVVEIAPTSGVGMWSNAISKPISSVTP